MQLQNDQKRISNVSVTSLAFKVLAVVTCQASLYCCVLYYTVLYCTSWSIAVIVGEFLDEHHRVLDLRLQPVMREITDSRARNRDELESLYRKIVSAILLRSGLGSATDISVVREATGEYFI